MALIDPIIPLYPGAKQTANLQAIEAGLESYGRVVGLTAPHRLCHYMAQLAHESTNFAYNREIWGPTKAQLGYEGRKDLGNIQPGDGKRFMGRGPIQLTGRTNYETFTRWCQSCGFDSPNFAVNPDLVMHDPWLGLVPIWYWNEGNPTRKSLNVYADANDIEMVTRRINGGYNGLADRKHQYTRIGCALLGCKDARAVQALGALEGHYPPDKVDGLDGPKTRAAIHALLLAQGEVS